MNNNKGKLPLIFFAAVIAHGIIGAVVGMILNNGTITIVAACVAFILLAGFMIFNNIKNRLAAKDSATPADGQDVLADRRFLRHSEGADEPYGMEDAPLYQPSRGRLGWDGQEGYAPTDFGGEQFAAEDGFGADFAAQELDDLGEDFRPEGAFGGFENVAAEGQPFADAQEEEPAGFRRMFARKSSRNEGRPRSEENTEPAFAPQEPFAPQPEQFAEPAEQFAPQPEQLAEQPTEAAEQSFDPAEEKKHRRLPFGARERRARAEQEEENARAEQEAARLAAEQARLEQEQRDREAAEAAQLAEAQAAAQAVMQGEDYYGVNAPQQSAAETPEDEEAFRPVLKLEGTEKADTAEPAATESAAEPIAAEPVAAEQAASAAVAAAGAAAVTMSATQQPPVQGQPLETFYDMDEEELLYRDCVEVWAADAKPCLLRLMKYIDSIEDKQTAAVFGRECEYVNAMIDRIIYFNHLEYIDSMLEVKEYDFKSMVMECLKRFSPFLIEKKLGLLWKGLDLKVRTDRRWFVFALTQIIFNSVEFTAKGGKIAITAKQSGEYVDLIIDDSGKGISAEEMPYVFVAGYMGDDSPNAAGRRTGMGLFIARSVLGKMGGDVFAESNPGKGTRVIMRMPTTVE